MRNKGLIIAMVAFALLAVGIWWRVSGSKALPSAPANTAGAKTYSWNGVKFSYPEDYTILPFGNGLYMSKDTRLPDSDITVFATTMNYYSGMTVDEAISKFFAERLADEQAKEKQTVKIGTHEYTKVVHHEVFGDFDQTQYYLQTPSGVFEYNVGLEEAALAQTILASMQIK